MPAPKKSLCIFIHFSEQEDIPYYVTIFVNELANYFDEVILSSNPKAIKQNPVISKNVTIQFQENKGYDFGRFYNTYKTIDPEEYFRIACVNDSNILINSLEHVLNHENISQFDFWGLLDSNEKPWFFKSSDNYHIQSHFLIFNQRAIYGLEKYFQLVDMAQFLSETNTKLLRQKVICNWEIGISQFIRSEGLNTGHFIDCKELTDRFKINNDSNISHKLFEELLSYGYPLIKKKVIFDQKREYERKEARWKDLVRKYGNSSWDLEHLIEELEQLKNEHKEKKHPGLINKIILHLQRKFSGSV
ncbi:MAG: hypothetical protein WCJ95_15395 [Mariniphaga sp.]